MKKHIATIAYCLVLVMLVSVLTPASALADEELPPVTEEGAPTQTEAPAETLPPAPAPEPTPEPEQTPPPTPDAPADQTPQPAGDESGGASDQPQPEAESPAPSQTDDPASQPEQAEEDTEPTEEELIETQSADSATERVISGGSTAPHPRGLIRSTLKDDDVSRSVAEAGYFPSKSDILNHRVGQAFTASMITWHAARGAACYRIRDTVVFASLFGGSPSYTPRPGDLIFYQAYASEYRRGVITSGNSNWLHAGIVAEVGSDYIRTIEGNSFQRVSLLTFSTSWYGGGMADFSKTWIVDIFGDDVDARSAYISTARSALEQADRDALRGRSGYSTWCESCYNGEYQNDTIASGYFQCPAAWCEMFVLWCGFNADIVRTGTVDITVTDTQRHLLSPVISRGEPLNGCEFRIYPAQEDGDYADCEPVAVISTDIAGNAATPELLYGDYHIEFDRPFLSGEDGETMLSLDFTLAAKASELCFIAEAGESAEEAPPSAPAEADAPVPETAAVDLYRGRLSAGQPTEPITASPNTRMLRDEILADAAPESL